jgi:hypothetical protein
MDIALNFDFDENGTHPLLCTKIDSKHGFRLLSPTQP